MLEYIVGVKGFFYWIPSMSHAVTVKRYRYSIDECYSGIVVRYRPKCTRCFSFSVPVSGIVANPAAPTGAFVVLSNREVHEICNDHGRIYPQFAGKSLTENYLRM